MHFYALMIENFKMAIVDIKKVFFATSLLIGSTAFAQKYEVKDIRIEGLEQINPGAVFTTLGLDPDAAVQTGNVKDLVERLYSTGLFKDVTVKTENGRILGRTRPKWNMSMKSFHVQLKIHAVNQERRLFALI